MGPRPSGRGYGVAMEMTPGYEPWGEQGSRLIDPEECPHGHPWGDPGWQRTYAFCSEHRGHPSWRCHCGAMLYLRRHDGEIVDALDCLDPDFGQPRSI